jgi:hypothetical protein
MKRCNGGTHGLFAGITRLQAAARNRLQYHNITVIQVQPPSKRPLWPQVTGEQVGRPQRRVCFERTCAYDFVRLFSSDRLWLAV